MSVYFIALGRYVKVGYSADPERRCRNLFSSSTSYAAPWDCPRGRGERELIGYTAGYKDAERRAHRALGEFGVGCEFYLNEPALRDYVSRCLEAGTVLDEVVVRPGGPAQWAGQTPPAPTDYATVVRAVDSLFSGSVA